MITVIDLNYELVLNVEAPATWYVDDVPGSGPGNPAEDFTSIQDAIDYALFGDTIYVYNGTYNEHLDVYKNLKITGENRNTTIIYWWDDAEVILINYNFVEFSEFTIKSNDFGIKTQYADYCKVYNNLFTQHFDHGIFLWYSNHNSIYGNADFGALYRTNGVFLFESDYNFITNNNFTENAFSGIHLSSSNNNIIQNNDVLTNSNGIYLSSSSNNTIKDNNAYNNNDGIKFAASDNNEIINNNMWNNHHGLYCVLSNGNDYKNNSIMNNEESGIYLLNSDNNTIESNEIFSNNNNGIYISNSNSNQINNNNISYQDEMGIELHNSQNNTISNTMMIENNIFIRGTFIEHWNSHDISTTNTVNSKPIYYWKNQVSGIIPSGVGEIILANCSNITILDQELSNGSVGIELGFSTNNLLSNNSFISNNMYGAYLFNSSNNTILNNNLSNNLYGLSFHSSNDNVLNNINISSNAYSGVYIYESYNNRIINSNISSNFYGVYFHTSNLNFVRNNNIFSNSNSGIRFYLSENNTVINCSLSNELGYDLYFGDLSHATTINTTFNKSKVYFFDVESTLTVKWFLQINVSDYQGNPVPNTNLKIEDNKNGTYNETFITNGNGFVNWIPLTEYIQNSSGITLYTSHSIVAWNDTLMGYAHPIIDESKTITIILGNGTLVDLKSGWNLISLPRIQSDTILQTVLQSIEGQYDAIQWYNITDSNDPWKHNHISKPSNWNDLNEINHTMGLWVHVTDPEGAMLVIFGDELPSTQNIALHPGWNLVGYPSMSTQNRTNALNNIDFGSDVDAIWTYNATTQTWEEITESDNFEVGRGYWIHSKVTKTWIVPL
jgi:parallel beta-helix repeat protein